MMMKTLRIRSAHCRSGGLVAGAIGLVLAAAVPRMGPGMGPGAGAAYGQPAAEPVAGFWSVLGPTTTESPGSGPDPYAKTEPEPDQTPGTPPGTPPGSYPSATPDSAPPLDRSPNLGNEGQSRSPQSLTVFYENDGKLLRLIGESDRHYTSGQGFALAWHEHAGDAIADALNLDADRTAMGLTLVQQMYTPNNIGPAFPDPDDRPYAGYLYLGGYWQRQHDDISDTGVSMFDHVELDLGVVGPSSAAEFNQEWVHDLFAQPDPDWRMQLRDEFTYNLTLRRKWRIDLFEEAVAQPTSAFSPQTWGLQMIPEVGLDVGNVYRRAHAGAALRYGFNLPDDFGPAHLTDPGSATGQPIAGLSTYVFGKAVGRYVQWNTFIEGSNTRNPSPSVSLEPWLGEFSAGFGVDWRRNNWVFNATYQQTLFTDEFKEQDTTDIVGSIALRAIYEF